MFKLQAAAVLSAVVVFTARVSSADDVGVGPSFKGPTGLQLYSLRDMMKKQGPIATLDKAKAFGFQYVEVALGTGQVNWPALFTAAQKAGVKYYFIEDESPSAVEQIPQSLRYLESLKW